MNLSSNIGAEIDRYLNKEMNQEELASFEVRLSNDLSLREDLEAQKAVINSFKLSARNELKYFLKTIPVNNRIKLIFKLSFAASIAIIISLAIWQPTKISNEKLYDLYAVNYSCDIEFNYENNNFNIRGNECEFDNLNIDECNMIKKAILFYKENKFMEASKLFEKILTYKNKNIELNFYLAMSQLKAGKFNKAENNFEYLSHLSNYKYQEQSTFYLALIYIKQGEQSKARNLLKILCNNNGLYANDAKYILSKLRWF